MPRSSINRPFPGADAFGTVPGDDDDDGPGGDIPGDHVLTMPTPGDCEHGDCVNFGGRGCAPTQSGLRVLRIYQGAGVPGAAFGALNPPRISAQVLQNTVSQKSADGNPRLWMLRSTAEEVATVGDINDWVNPIGRSSIQGAAPAGITWSGRSISHVRVDFQSTGPGDSFTMDAGGQPVEIYATEVSMALLTTTDVEERINDPIAAVDGATAIRQNASIGLEIMPIEASRGYRSTTLTYLLFQVANTALDVEVPRYAKSVQVFQGPAGAASVAWAMSVGQTGNVITYGTLPWIIGARKTEPCALMPGLALLQADVDVANGRFFAVTFEIEP